jgi:hypothetical protein
VYQRKTLLEKCRQRTASVPVVSFTRPAGIWKISSLSSRLVAGIVPGVERQPSKMLEVDENVLLKLINRWREEAQKAGQGIERADYFFFRTSRKASDIASNKKITASANSLFLRKYSFIAEHLTRSDGFFTRSNPLQIFP